MSKLIIKKQYSPEPRDIYFTVPNFISLLRIISIPFIAMLVSHHRMVTALVVLALSAISDGLDGMIARSFNQVSKIGQILDPIADRLLIFCSILALGVANIIPWWMLIVVGLRDLIMAVLILVLAQHDYGPLPVHFVGKAGTAMLLIAIVALIFADIWSNSAADTKSDAPRFASFPVSPENVPTKHRAIFSSSFAGLSSHHVQPASMPAMPQRHRHVDDDSLRLIDDLTNRPMDVLYSDSRLATKKRSAVSIWATRILVFLICIAVGAAGSVFVRQLSTDPRKEVRKQLASQLTEQTKRVGDLTKGVNDLRSQIESESESLASWSLNQTMQDDEMVNGTLPVQGEGIVLTVANPLSVSGDNADSSLPRENGSQVRVVTDSDLQLLVSLLWQSGAEAIAINGNRLGVQTSIRTAGSTILIGVNSVQSPYRIEAIGNQATLAKSVSKTTQKQLYDDFKKAGIYPQISKSKSITLDAAVAGDTTHVRKDK